MPCPLCRASPCVEARTRLGSFGSTTILLILVVSSRPTCVHVLPASTDLYMPSPSEPPTESPVPAYTMFASDCATYRADAVDVCELIEDREPRHARIVRFPNSAGGRP